MDGGAWPGLQFMGLQRNRTRLSMHAVLHESEEGPHLPGLLRWEASSPRASGHCVLLMPLVFRVPGPCGPRVLACSSFPGDGAGKKGGGGEQDPCDLSQSRNSILGPFPKKVHHIITRRSSRASGGPPFSLGLSKRSQEEHLRSRLNPPTSVRSGNR